MQRSVLRRDLSNVLFSGTPRTAARLKSESRRRPGLARLAVGVAVAAAGLFASAQASASQTLETYGASLTSNLTTSATSVQGIRPRADQRGVGLDGSGRAWSPLGWAIAGNPYENAWGSAEQLGDIRLDNGTYSPAVIDLQLPSAGLPWVVGRTFNALQVTSGGSHQDSDGYQGKNWMQVSQPEIVFFTGATADLDTVYVVYGADRYLEFQRTGIGNNEFKGKNGAAGVVQYVSGTPDTYVYTDQNGARAWFFGGNTASHAADWQFWKMSDAAGNTAYVGDSATGSTAVSSGYDSAGRITTAYDSADRRYTYTYTTLDSVTRLTRVKAETKSGGTWASPSGLATVGQVDYGYYQTGSTTYGDAGNLKLVTLTTPLSNGSDNLVRKQYYRYWVGAYNASTNPGYANSVQYVVDYEGYRQADWADSTFDDTPFTMTETSLKPYASAYFEYDSSRRVSKTWDNGQCGCGGGNNGTHSLSYADSTSASTYRGNSTYDTGWATRSVVQQPDGTYVTRYFDEVGQPLSKVYTNGDPAGAPTGRWATQVIRDSDGRVSEVRTPAANATYTHDSGGNPSGAFTANAGAGLIQTFVRETGGVDTKGYILDRKWQVGTGGTAYLDGSVTYATTTLTVGTVGVTRALTASSTRYTQEITSGSSGALTATMSYAYHSAGASNPLKLAVKSVTETNPTVSTGNNGSNAATTSARYLRGDGTTAYMQRTDGTFDYTGYTKGQVTRSVRDKSSDELAGAGSKTSWLVNDDPNTGWGIAYALLDSDGGNSTTDTTYDAQGRVSTVKQPDGRIITNWQTKLADGRLVSLSVPRVVTGTYYGPATYTVTNHAGKAEFSGTIAVAAAGTAAALSTWINTAATDPITALTAGGSLARMSTTIYSQAGNRVSETRSYFLIPGSGAGSAGTNYDATTFGYDDMGRRWRSKDPTGTVDRTVYDALGRTIEQWTGTNDRNFTGGDVSGSDTMIKVSATEYDSASSGGNGFVTKRTAYITNSTSGQRVTTYAYDARGRALLVTSPLAPHTLTKYDNLGRAVAVAQYSSTGSITPGTTDPAGSAAGDKANRVALSETFYDEMGRVWKTLRHKVTQSDGSLADSLASLTWYDDAGRVIKSRGEQLTKTAYDRMGRVRRQYTLAKDDDATYADAKTVTGEIVLREDQTVYAELGFNNEIVCNTVIMRVSIDRRQDDLANGTTGALDSNADSADDYTLTAANVKGRVSITAMWYDALDRITDSVAYGTNGIVGDGSTSTGTFIRTSLSVPARSDSALRTTTSYNDDGTVKEVTDPLALVTRYEYDNLGRQTKTIRNYNDGTAGGGTNDEQDQIVTTAYSAGLKSSMTAVLPAGQTSQVTTYTYGSTFGANGSTVTSNRLLQKVQYPDSAGGGDVVTFGYNAQNQQVRVQDQAGNVIETEYDTLGRGIHRKVTTLAGGFDGAVLRVSSTFDGRGMPSLVTQYDNATPGSGSVVNEVAYAYDDWGNIATFSQDRDSAVNAGGSVNDYAVTYTYAKAGAGTGANGGRNTLRRLTQDVNYTSTSKQSLTYDYSSASNSLDDSASRVTAVKVTGSRTLLATYSYLGVAGVIGRAYPEPNVKWDLFGASAGSYPDIDNFGRVIHSRWTKANVSPVDFYSVDLTYDRGSNITSTLDNLTKNGSGNRQFDVKYGIDGLNRVVDADEGTLSSGTISNRARRQIWTLNQAGDWLRNKLDLNGDGAYGGADELDDTSTFNAANELLTRDTETNGSTNYTLTHDAVGNMTDDGKDYTYVYDAFGRLRFLKTRGGSPAVVEEFTYNGHSHRIGWHYDVDASGTVDGSDPWYYFAYDPNWRMVATFRGADTNPKELSINHNAGLNGLGGSSPVDALVLRDRDVNTAWGTASDGVLESRVYFCQNWRGDVVSVLSDTGRQSLSVRYSAYGVPFGSPAGDLNADGAVNSSDSTQIASWISGSVYDVRADINLDGAVDSTDQTLLSGANYGLTLGRGKLAAGQTSSAWAPGVRKGYAGYEHDGVVNPVMHVRNRVLLGELGRWSRRDPLGYVDGVNLYEYVVSIPTTSVDPTGGRALDFRYCIAEETGIPSLGICPKASCGNGAAGLQPGEECSGPRMPCIEINRTCTTPCTSPPGTLAPLSVRTSHPSGYGITICHYYRLKPGTRTCTITYLCWNGVYSVTGPTSCNIATSCSETWYTYIWCPIPAVGTCAAF